MSIGVEMQLNHFVEHNYNDICSIQMHDDELEWLGIMANQFVQIGDLFLSEEVNENILFLPLFEANRADLIVEMLQGSA